MEAIRVIERPFKMEVARPRETFRGRRSEMCSTNVDPDPSESVKIQAKPLV